jgi:hypothetical protein
VGTEPSLDWNPATNGEAVVWESYEDLRFKVKIWDALQGISVIHTTSRDQLNPSIGQRFVVWEEHAGRKSEVWGYDLQSRDVFRVFEDGWNEYPRTSGDTIVWQQGHADKSIYICTVTNEVDNGPEVETERLTHHGGSEIYPDVDGETVVWKDDRFSGFGIVAFDQINGERNVCTNLLCYKPDRVAIRGGTIAFVIEDQDKQRDVYMATLPTADLNRDAKVNMADFAIFARRWGYWQAP